MKYLWMVVAGLLIFAWLKMRSGRSSDAPHVPRKSKDQVSVVPKNMVECVHCGLHVLHEDAISTQGRSYCCIEHLQKDQDQ